MSNKHALIVGVDRYSKLDKQYQLSGCVSDAKLIKSVLVEHFRFDESRIAELHDTQATRDAILAGMNKLVGDVARDDIVVFHFSGHGSRRTGATPSEDEGSGKDSTIMPHDSGRDPHPNRDIIDDEIHEWLGRLADKTRNITLIFDCCHSGTITRDAFGAQARAVEDDNRTLEAMGVDRASLPSPASAGTRAVGPGGWLAVSDNYVVMSGCRDNELSHEYTMLEDGKEFRNGAMTHFLTGALTRAKPGTTYRDVFEIARQAVNTKFANQNPQIEGTQDREIFGTRDIEPLRFISVGAVDGDRVTLSGGAAHGLVGHAKWTVYPPGTKQSEGTVPLGVVEIDSVGPLTAEAKVVERKGDIVIGARCVETAPSAAQYIFKVDLSQVTGGDREAMAAAISKADLLEQCNAPQGADARAYVLAPRDGARPDSAVPEVGRVASPSWAFVDRAGRCCMPLHATNEDNVIDTLIGNLETLARYRNALLLDNPDSDLDVQFNILKMAPDGSWESANGGDAVFQDGDRIAFEIVNNDDRAIFASVFDFGLTGKVALFYPPRKSGEMVGAGHTLRIGAGDPKKKITLSIPGKLPGDQGVETFKAFITTAETDFGWLQQEGTRAAATDQSKRSRLRQQFEAAYKGPATRDASFGGDDNDDNDAWTAINRSFILRRRNF